jgi:hypothetical protein
MLKKDNIATMNIRSIREQVELAENMKKQTSRSWAYRSIG